MIKKNIFSPSLKKRRSGILLHPTSLPSPTGMGDIGVEAEKFLSFLQQAGMTWWQMLPVGPTGYGNSPYNSPSAFAGNPNLLSIDWFVEKGLLETKDIHATPLSDVDRVKFEDAQTHKTACFQKAFQHYLKNEPAQWANQLALFRRQQKFWLEDFVLFSSLKEAHHHQTWTQWPVDLIDRDPAGLAYAKHHLSEQLAYHEFLQFIFSLQWKNFQKKAKAARVGLMGDVPIFVAHDSADVWAHPSLFYLEADGHPSLVAGVPPDYFSADGQKWGNPLYKWEVHFASHFEWWMNRLRLSLSRFDALRLDHFIGFSRAWAVPADAPTAREGQWLPGPQATFFKHIKKQFPKAQFIAEDLGLLTPQVESLRDQFQLPGMKILQFSVSNPHELPHNQPENFKKNSVVYTGTHDNDTTVGWFSHIQKNEMEHAHTLKVLKSTGQHIHWDMIEFALNTNANTVIIPMQDVLGLGTTARMNQPGLSAGNWEWRLRACDLKEANTQRLYELNKLSKRLALSIHV